MQAKDFAILPYGKCICSRQKIPTFAQSPCGITNWPSPNVYSTEDCRINVFYIDGKNLIVAVPRAGATPLNMNTGKIDNTGVEVEAAYRIHPHWSVETNYSYLHMDNPVLGAPEHKFYAGAMFSKNRWTVSTGFQYVANLYTDVDHVQTEDFVLWNINGSFKVTEWFDIWARGENLLAQRYEINAGYPMPKATIMAGINVKF